MSRIYIGHKAGVKPEIFRAPETPTFTTHGDKYNGVTGPFRTKAGALFMRDHGQGNPHCRCVRDAERLAKKYGQSK